MINLILIVISLTVKFCVTMEMKNQCPDLFFYYETEPLVNRPKTESKFTIAFNDFKLKKPEAIIHNEAQGPIWQITSHAYDTCCLTNKLKLVQLTDEMAVSEKMFQKNALNDSSKGIYFVSNTLDEHYHNTNEYSRSIRLLTSSSKNNSSLLFF